MKTVAEACHGGPACTIATDVSAAKTLVVIH